MQAATKRVVTALALMLVGAASSVLAQQQGPLTPPPKREVRRIPIESTAPPPPIPAEEIVRRFSEKEDEFRGAFEARDYKQSVRVQEFDAQGNATGEFQVIREFFTGQDGKRYVKTPRQPVSTLKATSFTLEDADDVTRFPFFPLTTDQLDKYNLTYEGKQPIDELTTYVFRVQPKALERRRLHFEGAVWVDDRDLVVVKTYGRLVSETTEGARTSLFSMFETYRENVEGKYWFPTYTRAEEFLKLESGEVRVRLTVRNSEFKPSVAPLRPTPPPAAPKPAPPAQE